MKWFVACLLFFTWQAHSARVISTSPAITEMISLLGHEKDIVAVTPYCQDATDRPKIGSALELDYEKVLALKPDIIFLQENTLGKVSKDLTRLKQNFVSLRIESLTEIFNAWRVIASELKADPKVISNFEQDISKTKTPRRVLIVVGAQSGKSVMIAGKKTFYADLIEQMGHEYASSSLGWPEIDAETMRALATKPLIIIHLAINQERLWSE